VAIGFPGLVPAMRGDVVAAAAYVSNWWFIAREGSYFARFGPPSPVSHLWSLAVEEQFYLLWPWVVLAGGVLLRHHVRITRGQARAVALGVTLAAATASFLAMALLYHPGLDPTRAYEGTDTRAGGLLIGAALAITWPTRRARSRRAANSTGGDPVTATFLPNITRWLLPLTLDLGGVAGLVTIALLIWRTNEYSAIMFRGGLALLSLATALVIAAVAHPGTLLGKALGIGPLRWLGVRSYGIYLWHYPVIVLTAPGGNPDGATSSGIRQALTRAWPPPRCPGRSWRTRSGPGAGPACPARHAVPLAGHAGAGRKPWRPARWRSPWPPGPRPAA